MKLLQLVRTCARTSLLLGLVGAFGVSDVYAQSKNRANEANQQRDQAERYLTEGQLDRAELAAMRAVELDGSSLTERARRVLVEVYLQRGELTDAELNIRAVRDVPNLPLPALEWTVRALDRLKIERIESSGDAAGAQSRLDVFPTDGLSTSEAEWASRMRARVTLRDFEQRRKIQAGREAVAAALVVARANNDVQGVRWLVAAEHRLGVVELEWAGAYDAARAAANELAALGDLRQPDLLWAQLVIARLDVRLALEGGDRAQARALAEALAARPDASALDLSWAQGFLLRLDYEAALDAKADNTAALAAQLAPFWAAEPPSERPLPPLLVTHRASAQVGLVAGFQSWQHRITSEMPSAQAADEDSTADPNATLACSDGCSSPTLSLAARGTFGVTEHLVVGGALVVTQPLLTYDLAGERGLPLVNPWVGVGWTNDGVVKTPEGAPPPAETLVYSVMVGPRLYVSAIRASPKVPLNLGKPLNRGMQLIPFAQLSGEVAIPEWSLDAQVNLGSNLLTHLAELDVGYRHGDGAWTWRAGLTGGLVTGKWAIVPLGEATALPSTMTDWRVGLGFSADWERP